MTDRNSKKTPVEAPCHASLKSFLNASFTVEASVILPLFLSLMILIIFFIRILVVHSLVQQAMDESVRLCSSVWINELDDDNFLGEYASAGGLVLYAQKKLRDKGLDGFVLFMPEVDGEFVDLTAYYKMDFPLAFFGKQGLNIAQRSVSRKWIGDNLKEDSPTEEKEEKYVYTTQTGKLYHISRYCKYIWHEPKNVNKVIVPELRNSGGKKYSACLYCKPSLSGDGQVYITDWGEAYHKTLGCHHLNPEVFAETEDDAIEKGLTKCSTCGKE